MEFPGLNIEIKDVQMLQLEILLEFDKICKDNDINYQLFAGTLLGAIRHNGFIPWDDDIDVCMLRKDYYKFIKVCQTDLNSKYFLQTYETDEEYIMQFAKIRKNNTKFIETSTSECNINHGIYIDIFPLDNIFPNTVYGNFQQKILYFLGRINLSRIKKLCLNSKKRYEKYISLIFYYILKLFPNKTINRLLTKIECMFKNSNTKYVTHLTNGASVSTYNKYMMDKNLFYDTIYWEFEGYKFPIPRNYDSVLTRLFGDYMTPPSTDMQRPHHGVIEINLNNN